jgi:hypothetical protein
MPFQAPRSTTAFAPYDLVRVVVLLKESRGGIEEEFLHAL